MVRKEYGVKSKNLIIAVVILVLALGFIFVSKPFFKNRNGKKTISSVRADGKNDPYVSAANKTFTKGMGGITVTVRGSDDKKQSVRIRAFRKLDKNSSVYVTTFVSDRLTELFPGTYDMVVETIPQTIYKNITVSEGNETVKDLGVMTGAIIVKAINSKEKDMMASIRMMYPKSNFLAAVAVTNRQMEMIPGVYDMIIETMPRQTKNNFKIEAGKVNVLDLGVVSGALIVKAVDENKKAVRMGVRVKSVGTNTAIASMVTNNAIELIPGAYDVDILSKPVQAKKDIKITAGKDTVIEAAVSPQLVQKPAVPVKKKK